MNRRHKDRRRPKVERPHEMLNDATWAYHPTKGWRRVKYFTYHAIRKDFAIPDLIRHNRQVTALRRKREHPDSV